MLFLIMLYISMAESRLRNIYRWILPIMVYKFIQKNLHQARIISPLNNRYNSLVKSSVTGDLCATGALISVSGNQQRIMFSKVSFM